MNQALPHDPPFGRSLILHNRQRTCRIQGAALRRLTRTLLEGVLHLDRYDLAIHLISPVRMAEANRKYLGHEGPTDVITFDYADPGPGVVWGELLVCPAMAVQQARDYRTTWPSEVARYIIHGILHLRGYHDDTAAARRSMKREEDRLLRALLRKETLDPIGR
jgi:probable rRNA maturation factor